MRLPAIPFNCDTYTLYQSLLVLSLSLMSIQSVDALSLEDGQSIPHVGSKAKKSFQDYVVADDNRAFVIAPGGAWAWSSSKESVEQAKQEALQQCARYTRQKCIPYALNDDVVFDSESWAQLWGPYKSAKEARLAPEGTSIGRRFPELALTSASGEAYTLGDFRGRVVLLHFWGSWCPPCCREIPRLAELTAELEASGAEVEVVAVPVREEFSVSLKWTREHGLALPLYDAGAHAGDDGNSLNLKGGEQIPDRAVAPVFPATYVLDKNGVIVFSRTGPIKKWNEYLPFLLDAAERSGQSDISRHMK